MPKQWIKYAGETGAIEGPISTERSRERGVGKSRFVSRRQTFSSTPHPLSFSLLLNAASNLQSIGRKKKQKTEEIEVTHTQRERQKETPRERGRGTGRGSLRVRERRNVEEESDWEHHDSQGFPWRLNSLWSPSPFRARCVSSFYPLLF